MADSVRYKISVEPREELTDEQGNTKNVISGEVGKRLGGSGVAVVTNYAGNAGAQGYTNGVVAYKRAVDNTTTSVSTVSGLSLLFLKNTGHKYSSATTLGEKLDRALRVTVGGITISVLDPGEPFGPLKDDNAGIGTIHVQTVDLDDSVNITGEGLAFEFLACE